MAALPASALAQADGPAVDLRASFINDLAPATGPPVLFASPTVAGSPIEGRVLTAASGSWSPSATSVAYQWQRDDGRRLHRHLRRDRHDLHLGPRRHRRVVSRARRRDQRPGQRPGRLRGRRPGHRRRTRRHGRARHHREPAGRQAPDRHRRHLVSDRDELRLSVAARPRARASSTSPARPTPPTSPPWPTSRARSARASPRPTPTGRVTATAAAVGPITSGRPVNSVLPIISGAVKRGSAAGGQLRHLEPGRQRLQPTSGSATSGSGFADITGATGTSYTPTVDDLGVPLRVVVTATNAYGSATVDRPPPTGNRRRRPAGQRRGARRSPGPPSGR